ncbi:MAG: cell division protein ZapE [Alicyclobacillus sp.]|nr:cell division protein ZapE [Alicyclobacillus sp.]
MKLRVPKTAAASVQTYDESYFRREIPELNEWGATDAEIRAERALLLEYLRQRDICAHCQGFERCGKEGDMRGFEQHLERYGPQLTVRLRRCAPYREAMVRQTVRRWQPFSGALERDKQFRLENFPVEQRRKYPKLFRFAVDFAEHFTAGQSADGLYLFGPPGVGKTHLLLGVVNRLTERGVPALFVRSDSVFDRMRHLIADNGDLEPLLDAYATVPFLGIDEFAQERANDFTLEKLFRIVNHRFHSQLPTWFTSNYAPPEMYRKNGIDIHDSVAPLRSRIMQMAQMAKLDGEDARQSKLRSLT